MQQKRMSSRKYDDTPVEVPGKTVKRASFQEQGLSAKSDAIKTEGGLLPSS